VTLASGGYLDVTGDTLGLDATTGSLTLAGGTLFGGTVTAGGGARVIVASAGGTLDGVTLNADLDLTTAGAAVTVLDGLTLGGTATLHGATLNFSGTQTLAGTGNVVFVGTGPSSLLRVNSGTTLTIGPGIAIHGGNATVGSSSNPGTVVNQGTIADDIAGATLTLNLASFSNQGALAASSGSSLTVGGLTGTLGSVTLTGTASSLSANGHNYTISSSLTAGSGQALALLGTFGVATGVTVTVTAATLTLGSTPNLAAFTVTGSALNVQAGYTSAQLLPLFAGNRVTLGTGGILDNTGSTLILDAGTGSLTLAGGTLLGGTVTAGGGARVIGTSSGGTLEGVTLNADLDLTAAGASATALHGLTLNGTATLHGTSLTFSGTQTLAGAGNIVFAVAGTSSLLGVDTGNTLTIGPGITIHGGHATLGPSFSGAGAVVNQGTIAADVAGATITINSTSFSNQGTLRATGGGSLSISNFTLNSGTMTAGVGSVITVNGSFTQGSGGTINVALGGTASSQIGRINVTGAATLAGTLNVTLANGFMPASGNMFQVLTYASPNGTFGQITGPDGVVFDPMYTGTALILEVA
jgi:hypothetical protein